MTCSKSYHSTPQSTSRRAALLLGVAAPFLLPILAHAQDATPTTPSSDTVSAVEVIAVTPLPGTGLTKDKVAAPVQTFSAKQIDNSNATDLSRFLQREADGVYVNDVQNNPLQPDINYRGYTASPLLGTPQGLSVYMDGVRLNQPFGDVVSWDLIPEQAINRTTLIPGSNPVYGLNTLGGAISIDTKSGLTTPGSEIDFSGANHQQYQGTVETGGAANGFDWYGTVNHFEDGGWREYSPSKADQGFGKIGWSNDTTRIALSYTGARTNLTGNGLQDERLLAADPKSVYTLPDNTKNVSNLFNLTGTHKLADGVNFSWNGYDRTITTNSYNGDANDDSSGENLYQAACTTAGATSPMSTVCQARQTVINEGYNIPLVAPVETLATTPFPFIACLAQAAIAPQLTTGKSGEPYEKCDGLINRSNDTQTDQGFSGQFNVTLPILGHANTLVAGAAGSRSTAHFQQSTQFGYLLPNRGIVGATGPLAFSTGLSVDDDGDLVDNQVNLKGNTDNFSAFASDTIEIISGLNVTAAARYDSTKLSNLDFLPPPSGIQIDASGKALRGVLTGNHDYDRINPSISATWQAAPMLNLYAGYSENSRAPTAIELGCSDPENPCRLPNALAGDPPLNKVVANTIEGGARIDLLGLHWTLDGYRTDNEHDILFVSDDPSGEGYFKNFGKTRRQGGSVGVNGAYGPLTFGANYNYIDATYQSPETIGAEGNSTSVNNEGATPVVGQGQEGTIDVRPGDKIPLVPQNVIKANADWAINDKVSISGDVFSVSRSYVRGDENNQHRPDGIYYLGQGKLPGYTILNLGASFNPIKSVKLFVQADNVLDEKYYTSGQLGFTEFDANGVVDARPNVNGPSANNPITGERPQQGVTFYSPGAPRSIKIGVKVALGR